MIYINKVLYKLLIAVTILSTSVFFVEYAGFFIYFVIIFLLIFSTADFLSVPKAESFILKRELSNYLSIGRDNSIAVIIEKLSDRDCHILVRDLYPEQFECLNDTFKAEISDFCRMEYSVKPFKKGEYFFKGVEVRVNGRFGLIGRQYFFELNDNVRVYPDIIELKKYLKLASYKRLEESGYKKNNYGGNVEFDFLREYLHGDSYRAINWKATARRNFPVTQINKKEVERSVVVMFDCGRMMTTKYFDLTKLDYAINAALLLAASVINGNDHFGFLAFSDTVNVFMKPDNSRKIFDKILSRLYTVEPAMVKSNYKNAYRFMKSNINKNSIVFVFSEIYNRVVSQDIADMLILLKKSHTVKFINFEENEKLERGNNLRDLARFTVQLNELAERKSMIHKLNSSGIETISVNNTDIMTKTVNAYLSM
jgi:uncharacterized protein (DUF58 family)